MWQSAGLGPAASRKIQIPREPLAFLERLRQQPDSPLRLREIHVVEIHVQQVDVPRQLPIAAT